MRWIDAVGVLLRVQRWFPHAFAVWFCPWQTNGYSVSYSVYWTSVLPNPNAATHAFIVETSVSHGRSLQRWRKTRDLEEWSAGIRARWLRGRPFSKVEIVDGSRISNDSMGATKIVFKRFWWVGTEPVVS